MADKKPDTTPKTSAGEVQKRVGDLVARVKAEPDNPEPLMELSQTYVEIFLKTRQDEVLSRIVQCLDRASKLETDTHLPALERFLTVVRDEAKQLGFKSRCSELDRIAERVAERVPPEPEEAPIEEASEDREAVASDFTMSDIDSMVGGSDQTDFDPLANAMDDVDFEMEFTSADEEEMGDEVMDASEQATGTRGRGVAEREHQAANAQALAQVQQLFEEEDINGILQLYAEVSETRIHRRIMDRLAEKVGEWGIEPVLAAASLDTDEQVFRQLMRNLLKGDRVELCRSIDYENYSPDLQRVSVRVLTDLRTPAAIPKLEQAMLNDDDSIRIAAIEGLTRLGHLAQRTIPKLLDRVSQDSSPEVRRLAADALRQMDLKEAYQALETLADSKHLDGPVYDVLEDLREKYGVSTRRKKKKKVLSAEEIQKRKKMIGYIVGAILLIALLVWQYVLKPQQ